MKILRVGKTPFYDVFIGDGWYGHTRVRVNGNIVHYQSGKHLTKIQYIQISKTVGDKK
jgi:hypothetical protein